MKKALLLTTLLLVLPGCGGANKSQDAQAFGRATFRIAWPESSRLIPQASTSIEIKVLNGDKVVATRVLARPATEVTLEKLPAKKLVNLVRAFPNADATGVAQAEARAQVEIKADETVEVKLTMNSTIERLEPSAEGRLFVGQGEHLALSATPRNAAGEIVIVKADALRWTTSAPTMASVDSAGRVTGVGSGEVTVTVADPESGKSVTFAVFAGPVGRVVYSQIEGNVRGDHFAQSGHGQIREIEVEDPGGGDFPALEYGFDDPFPYTFPSVSREFLITLSPDIAPGTRLPVPSLVRDPFVDVELVELQTVYDGSGNIIKRIERVFQGVSGHVTLVKIEGSTYTLRLENVTMQGSPGFHYSFADEAEGQGTFIANGTLTFED